MPRCVHQALLSHSLALDRFLVFQFERENPAFAGVVVGVALLLVLVLAPWWLTLLLGLVATLAFKDFYEIVLLGFGFDLIYGQGYSAGGLLQSLVGLLTGAAVFLLVFMIKTRLIVYNR